VTRFQSMRIPIFLFLIQCHPWAMVFRFSETVS
jgi:hypothetical protein